MQESYRSFWIRYTGTLYNPSRRCGKSYLLFNLKTTGGKQGIRKICIKHSLLSRFRCIFVPTIAFLITKS